jgi:hypothetical protein
VVALFGQRYVAVLGSLAAMDVDQLSLTVDIRDFQTKGL